MTINLPKVSLFFVALFLVLFAVSGLGWIAVSAIALGIVALIGAILLFIQVFFTP